jgi:YHS domain-containing protein
MKILTPVFAAALTCLAPVAFAADAVNVSNGLTITGNPLGLHGIDPVSMFEASAPRIGDAGISSEHEGVDYYFASANAKAAFDADPAAMLPQYGGFCAFGVYAGKKLDGDVRFADIVDGKLYLFVNADIFEKYLEQKDEILAGAEAKWPEIREVAVGDL